jgi:hypothetical protein
VLRHRRILRVTGQAPLGRGKARLHVHTGRRGASYVVSRGFALAAVRQGSVAVVRVGYPLRTILVLKEG